MAQTLVKRHFLYKHTEIGKRRVAPVSGRLGVPGMRGRLKEDK